MAYLEKNELEKIQEMNAEFTKMKIALGETELQKQTVINAINELKTSFAMQERMLIDKYCEQGRVSTDFIESMSLEPSVRERLLCIFNKAMRRRLKYYLLWMSSGVCMDDTNILNLLPIDLSRSVVNFV